MGFPPKVLFETANRMLSNGHQMLSSAGDDQKYPAKQNSFALSFNVDSNSWKSKNSKT